MSYWSSVEIEGFEEGPEARPWVDVAHNSGFTGSGGRVLLRAGRDLDHISNTEVTPVRARGLAHALVMAAALAERATLT